MGQDIKPLAQVTEAIYSAKIAAMQKVKAEEAAVKSAIAELDEALATETRASQHDHALRSLGADILWQTWAGRKKASLLMQLAQVQVRKDYALREMRAAFGKKDVIERLIRAQTEVDRIEKARRSY